MTFPRVYDTKLYSMKTGFVCENYCHKEFVVYCTSYAQRKPTLTSTKSGTAKLLEALRMVASVVL